METKAKVVTNHLNIKTLANSDDDLYRDLLLWFFPWANCVLVFNFRALSLSLSRPRPLRRFEGLFAGLRRWPSCAHRRRRDRGIWSGARLRTEWPRPHPAIRGRDCLSATQRSSWAFGTAPPETRESVFLLNRQNLDLAVQFFKLMAFEQKCAKDRWS